MHIQILILMKAYFFWKEIRQINYYNKTSKEINLRQSIFRSSHWEPISIPSFLSKSLKNICDKVYFCNVAGYSLAVFLKKEIFFRHFSRTLPIDSVRKITEQLVWKKYFQSKHFQWQLLFMPTISHKINEVNILTI